MLINGQLKKRPQLLTVKYRTSHLIKKLNIPYHTDPRSFVLSGFSALQLPAQTGAGLGCTLSQRTRDALAHGHHLGRGQSADHVPAQHGGPAGHAGLELGLLHQPQRGRLPHQVIKTDHAGGAA